MQVTQISSQPCANEEMARTALDGLLIELGRNADVKIVSLDITESDGGFVAVASLELQELDVSQDDEDEGRGEGDARDADPQDEDHTFFLLHGYWPREMQEEQSLAESFPEPEIEDDPLREIGERVERSETHLALQEQDREGSRREDASLVGEEEWDKAVENEAPSESLSEDFERAESLNIDNSTENIRSARRRPDAEAEEGLGLRAQ